jgi:putative proteasome-type protease
VAIKVREGVVFASDSRTNAGADQVSVYSKMHAFGADGDRSVVILTAGNLATTQAVLRRVRRDRDDQRALSLDGVRNMAELADYLGEISATEQKKHKGHQSEKFNAEASFIVGGQIAGEVPQIFLVYPQGNHIRATPETPYLQIGETKYGKPILDRIVSDGLPLDLATRCALVSMDSTLRSNATVGPPIELLSYSADSVVLPPRLVLQDDSAYLRELRVAWQEALKRSFAELPAVPAPPAQIRLVDVPGDASGGAWR